MDANVVIGQGHRVPGRSPVANAPPPVPRPSADVARPAQGAPDATLQLDEEQVNAAIDILAARKAARTRSGTRFSHDEITNQVVAQIVNESNEVILQIPSEEALRIAARFRQVTGLFFDLKI